jgi:glutamate 5-kinase
MQVAALVQADYLFLLTDVDCLYTANPKVRRGCGRGAS